jgi:RNA polymerase sigma factor (sigma-70 family)
MSPSPTEPEATGPDALRAASLERLYRDQAPRLARYFRRHLHGSDDVPDLVQETFARLAGARKRDPERPLAYLQRIARNLLFDRARQRKAGLSLVHFPAGDHSCLSVAPDQEHALDVEDMLQLYRRALGELPAKTRDAFLLHRLDELSYREIALKMAISIPTVQYHVARALMHIDKTLDEG